MLRQEKCQNMFYKSWIFLIVLKKNIHILPQRQPQIANAKSNIKMGIICEINA